MRRKRQEAEMARVKTEDLSTLTLRQLAERLRPGQAWALLSILAALLGGAKGAP